MPKQMRGPEGAADVEGHIHVTRGDTKATTPDEPGVGPEKGSGKNPRAVEDDVEGHSMLQNPMLSRSAGQNREREIQRNLRQHELKSEARRPFHKDSR
jgi:hypothetical protein